MKKKSVCPRWKRSQAVPSPSSRHGFSSTGFWTQKKKAPQEEDSEGDGAVHSVPPELACNNTTSYEATMQSSNSMSISAQGLLGCERPNPEILLQPRDLLTNGGCVLRCW
jgi:hypothetical protein